jgi:2-oxoisovalerate dehydrogenase E2 component (dihydrolipoyl transacylase)
MVVVKMPQLGESVTEGTIIQWFKQPGDPVAFDEPLCEIETEKVTAELPSAFEGTMGAILVPQGETVDVDTPLCEIVEAGAAPAGVSVPPGAEDLPVPAAPGGWSGGPMAIREDEPAPAPEPVSAAVPAARAAASPVSARSPEPRSRFYSPVVMRLATEHNINLESISGSGVGGRVTRKDIEAAIKSGTAPVARPRVEQRRPTPHSDGAYTPVPLTGTRKTIAERLTRSNLEAPQAWTMVEADATALEAARARERARFEAAGGKLTLLPFFTLAVCQTLAEFPALNARWEDGELRRYAALNIGIAVAAETGLVVPVVHNAGELSGIGLANRINDLAELAHSRSLRIEDIEGGTFTVNNTGSFGSIASKPIVNHPQVAIVTMERVVRRPVVVDGDAIAIRPMFNICLSFDHRAMDGLDAGQFLAALKARVENFAG